jgi:CHAT domain-containing protein
MARSHGAGDETVANLMRNMAVLLHWQGPHPELARAVAYYDSADALQGSVYRSTGRSFEQELMAARSFGLFPLWSMAWLARAAEPDVGPTESAMAALAAVERGRSQALLELIRGSRPGRRPGGDLVAEGQAHVDAVRRAGVDAALVYLAVGPYTGRSDTLVTWLIRRSGEVRVFRRAYDAHDLAAAVDSLRAALGVNESCENPQPRGRASYQSTLRPLAGLLLPPEALAEMQPGEELLIVADGPLYRVPFAALPTETGEPLGLRYALRYAPSLAALAEAGTRPRLTDISDRRDALRGALVAVNPTMPRVNICGQTYQLQALPEAETSALAVAAHLGVTALVGPEATETRVRDLAPQAPLIHLATHAYAYEGDGQARESFLALAPETETEGAGDGRLTLGEIMDQIPSLRAELVTLAACRTGLGSPNRAEGTIGLQRGLLAKGARSVLVSLWVVDAGPTGLLMESFYTDWLEGGLSKAEALRRAQLRVHSTPGWEHPRHWAAFQLVGGN